MIKNIKPKIDIIFIGLFLIGVLFRLYAFFNTYVISRDSPLYLYQAMVIFQGDLNLLKLCGFSGRIRELNFFSISIVPFYYIFKDWELAGKFLSFFSSSLSILLHYLILKNFFQGVPLYLTLLVYLFNPTIIEESAEILRESYFTFLVLLGVYTFIKALKSSLKKQIVLFGLSNIFWLLSAWVRVEGIVFIILTELYLFVRLLISMNKKALVSLLSFLFVPTLLFLVVLVHLLWFKGFLITELYGLSIFVNPFNQPLKYTLESFKYLNLPVPTPYFWDMVAQNLWLIAFSIVFFYKFLPALSFQNFLFILFSFKNLRNYLKTNSLLSYFIFVSCSYFIILWYFIFTKWYMEKRYMLPLIFLISPLIAIGIINLKNICINKFQLTAKQFVILLSFYIIIFSVFKIFKPDRKNLLYVKEVAMNIANTMSDQYLNKCAKEACQNMIFTREGRIFFYISNSKRLPLCPKAENRIFYANLKNYSTEEIVNFILSKGYKYAVLEEKVFGDKLLNLKEALEKNEIKVFILK